MLQILNWLCLISICGLSTQIFVFMCENAINLFNNIKPKKKLPVLKSDISIVTDELEEKIAK